MKELIALNVVILAGFVLGSFFGAGVYHAIQRLAQKGKAEVEAAEAKVDAILRQAKDVAAQIIKDAQHRSASDVKDGLPHA